jgi:hypothetical protein
LFSLFLRTVYVRNLSPPPPLSLAQFCSCSTSPYRRVCFLFFLLSLCSTETAGPARTTPAASSGKPRPGREILSFPTNHCAFEDPRKSADTHAAEQGIRKKVHNRAPRSLLPGRASLKIRFFFFSGCCLMTPQVIRNSASVTETPTKHFFSRGSALSTFLRSRASSHLWTRIKSRGKPLRNLIMHIMSDCHHCMQSFPRPFASSPVVLSDHELRGRYRPRISHFFAAGWWGEAED